MPRPIFDRPEKKRKPVPPEVLDVLKTAADYESKKTVKNQDGDEVTVYEYSDSHVQKRTEKKVDRVNRLRSAMDQIVANAKKHMKADDPNIRLPALAVLLINETYERVGNAESAKEGHHGVTTWLKKHVTFKGDKAHLKYDGKGGIQQEKVVEDPELVRALRTLALDKADDDLLLCDGRKNEGCAATPERVNSYLQEYDITAKDIRGFHANRLMQEKLKKLPSATGETVEDRIKERKGLFKDTLEEVAEEVGHEPETLRNQYLAPSLEPDFVEDGKVNKSVRASDRILALAQPLRTQRDYGQPSRETGYDQPGVNPYLNTPPTELARKVKNVKDPKKKRLIEKALEAWRGTYGNPLAPAVSPAASDKILAVSKQAGWWAVDPETLRQTRPPVDKGGLQNAIPGTDPGDHLYVGDGPADMMGDLFSNVDLAYRACWGRPANPKELEAVFRFCIGPMQGEEPLTPVQNGWVDKIVDLTGRNMKDIAGLPPEAIGELRAADIEYRNSKTPNEKTFNAKVEDVLSRFLKVSDKKAAEVGTDSATIWAISPEGLRWFIEDSKWIDYGWDEWSDHLETMEEELREHGGAVFHTGADGIWDVQVIHPKDESYKIPISKGFKAPYGTEDYRKDKTGSDDHTGSILDPIKANRMDWLWDVDKDKGIAFVKPEALDAIENILYDYLEKSGWPKPVYKWILDLGIQGGAASYQWHEKSDVDVLMVVDWLKLFKMMEDMFTQDQWKEFDLESQYFRVQHKQRIRGTLVAKRLAECIAGKGPWKGKGIRNKANLSKVTGQHPLDFQLVRGLHKGDLRFADQPPVVMETQLSSYLVSLPTKRKREEEGKTYEDVDWMRKIQKLPTGFNLKRDVPEMYDLGLEVLRYTTMPFDFLYEPDGPQDLIKGMEVLKNRFYDVLKRRTDGYREMRQNPDAHTFKLDGDTYFHPDVFPINIGIKLLEKAHGKKLIKAMLKDSKLKDSAIRRDFPGTAAYVKKLIDPVYRDVRSLLDDYKGSKPFTFKNPQPFPRAASDRSSR